VAERFEEIEVERINIVDSDGTLRLTISNNDRMPDPIVDGKVLGKRGGIATKAAGFIFFNDEGDECGGFTWSGGKTEGGYSSGMGISFDQFKQDEILTITHSETNGERYAGINISDRPTDVSIVALMDQMNAINEMEDGEEKTTRRQKLLEEHGAKTRVYLGRSRQGEAALVLGDAKGRPRLLLMVDANDKPILQFLGEDGQVTYALSPEGEDK
jgi:hypothetical protein